MPQRTSRARLGVDIGGTFTDVALEAGGRRYSAKILTTPEAPERAVLEAIAAVLREAVLEPADLSIIIHGTTLATNAIIERKGAKTALLTTEGFRDTIEIRHENRFEQYDVNIDLPPPLVPRRLRFPVRERIDARRPDPGAARRSWAGADRRSRSLPSASRAWRSVSCTALRTRHTSAAQARSSPSDCPASRSPCRARCRPRCANTSASQPPAPTPMSSR